MPDQPAESHDDAFALDPSVPGWPPSADRRKESEPRRVDDRTILQQCKDFASHASQWVMLVGAAVGVVAWGGALLGVKLTGTPQAVAAVKQEVDSTKSDLAHVKTDVAQLRGEFGGLRYDVQFLSYQFCIRDNGQDRVAIERCRPIMENFRKPSAP